MQRYVEKMLFFIHAFPDSRIIHSIKLAERGYFVSLSPAS